MFCITGVALLCRQFSQVDMLHLGNLSMQNFNNSEAFLVCICRPTRMSLRARAQREQLCDANSATDKVTDLYVHVGNMFTSFLKV